ncbi:MAG: NifB/NifX family molybdenum-iron cluster-binding protein [Bacillota bacterium]|nr:NifB/NifX family molybdenum-iron cluster-binding protein [Bacillota bacterium]
MRVALPVDADGQIFPHFGRAPRLAVATLEEGKVRDWQVLDVDWGSSHDLVPRGEHHRRVFQTLREQGVDLVLAGEMGEGMVRSLSGVGVEVVLGVAGDARSAAESYAAGAAR